jgi:sortase B
MKEKNETDSEKNVRNKSEIRSIKFITAAMICVYAGICAYIQMPEKDEDVSLVIATKVSESSFYETSETKVTTSVVTTAPETTPAETTTKMDYTFISSLENVKEYHEINSDVVGWIYIPGTSVDYPILHKYEDNDYYLSHAWNDTESQNGSIVLDCHCTLENTGGSNSIMYGHNMANGSMFAGITKYANSSFRDRQPYIEINTLTEQRLYEVYACCDIFGLEGSDFPYWDDMYINLDTQSKLDEHNSLVKKYEYYNTGMEAAFNQDIITLQTCRGFDGMRTVVFARRVI